MTSNLGALGILLLALSLPAHGRDEELREPNLGANCTGISQKERAHSTERHADCLARYGARDGSVRPRAGKNCVYAACEQFHGCGAADSPASASALPEESPVASLVFNTNAVASQLRQLPMTRSCTRAVDDYSACNAFVSEALSSVYGIDDFKKDKASRYFPDHIANDIANYIQAHPQQWRPVGSAGNQQALHEAQRLANEGYAVIAVRAQVGQGHVALIIPGEVRLSAAWRMKVPNSASMFLGKADQTYIGGLLSKAWRPQDKGEVQIYYRERSRTQ
jgi:hypothetical protein